MAIGYAVDNFHSIDVFDENGTIIFSIATSGQPDGLAGFTPANVTVRNGKFIDIYTETGALIRSIPAA